VSMDLQRSPFLSTEGSSINDLKALEGMGNNNFIVNISSLPYSKYFKLYLRIDHNQFLFPCCFSYVESSVAPAKMIQHSSHSFQQMYKEDPCIKATFWKYTNS